MAPERAFPATLAPRAGRRQFAARAAGAAALLALAGCAPSLPPIAALGGDAAFKARIAEAFPPGSRAERLRTALLRNGFVIVEDPQTGFASALDRPQNLPCYSVTRVDWREDKRGRIAIIQAQRHPCS